MQSKKNNSKLLALIEAIQTTQCETVPPDEGWFTTLQLAEELNCSVGHASKMILKGQRAGVIETRKFRLNRNGAPRVVPHFRKK
jgi:predicted transcriptional regulator